MKQKLMVGSLSLIPLLAVADTDTVSAQALTTEQSYSAGALQIHADSAWAKGATGKGITVAVVDTGVYRHSEFGSRLLAGASFVPGVYTSNDDNGHGTHVAGIIGAAMNNVGMAGVAYDATLLPVKVLSSTGSGTSTSFTQGMAYTVGRARIVNMSLGASGPFGESAMRNGVNNGQLLVAAAGNSGLANPAWPARYAKESWARGQIIAVGAVDRNNVIAWFSNRAGDTANYYLVAPGVSILSTYNNGGYAYMSGTSMATPFVSGAAALVMGYWPYLTSAQVADILFKTATDLGTPGVDAVYGRGLVNLDKALQPVGTLSVQSGSKARPLAGTTLSVAQTPYAGQIKRAAAGGAFSVVSTDDYGRGFQTDLGAAVHADAVPYVDRMLDTLDTQLSLIEKATDTSRLAVRYAARAILPSFGFTDEQKVVPVIAALSYRQKFADGSETAVGWGGTAQRFFGLSATGLAPAGVAAERFSVPYLAYVPNQAHVGYALGLGDATRVKFGFASVPRGIANPFAEPTGNASLALMEVERSFDHGVLMLSGGQLREKQSLLGSYSEQALSLGGAPTTRFVSLGGALRLGAQTALSATASLGRSAAFANPDSVISDVAAVITASWSLGLTRSNAFRPHDAVALSVAMPTKPISGSVGLLTSVAQNADGSLAYEARRVSLVPGASEIATELSYTAPAGKNASLSGAVGYRVHPGHDAQAAPETAVGVRYRAIF